VKAIDEHFERISATQWRELIESNRRHVDLVALVTDALRKSLLAARGLAGTTIDPDTAADRFVAAVESVIRASTQDRQQSDSAGTEKS